MPRNQNEEAHSLTRQNVISNLSNMAGNPTKWTKEINEYDITTNHSDQ